MTTAPPALIDTHVHLNLGDYDVDRAEVIDRARAAGVFLMMNIGFDLETSRASIRLAEEHEFIYASVGLHPHEAADASDSLMEALENLAGHPRVVALGETGLDYYRDLSPREDQRRVFARQIDMANRLGLPLIVHNRDALDDVLAVIDEAGGVQHGGVMHCFPGDADYARRVLDRGFHIGIGGPVTYSSRGRLREVAETVPPDRLLLETDAPWLPPVPHRGKRNEPAHVALVAERIAEIRGADVRDLARLTSGNAMRLFGIRERGKPAIAYEMWGNLYLNITNRCTNECEFCVRYKSDILWGYDLRLKTEPTVDDVVSAIGDPTRYREIVFCGYGEPTLRLDALLEIARRVRGSGVRIRLDTNGHASLIWNRNVAPELAEVLDAVSVSVNAHDAETYERICHPRFGASTFDHVLRFARDCVKAGLEVTASVVDVPGVDLNRVKTVASDLGVPLRVRGGERSGPDATGG